MWTQKIFKSNFFYLDQILVDPIFSTKSILVPKIFQPICFGTQKNFLDPIYPISFLGPICCWTKNIFGPNFFWIQNSFGPKFFYTEIFMDQIFFGPDTYFDPIFLTKIFWTQNLDPTFFWPKSFYPKFVWTQNSFVPKLFLSRIFSDPNIFQPKFFMKIGHCNEEK